MPSSDETTYSKVCAKHDLIEYRLTQTETLSNDNRNKINALSVKIGILSGLISAFTSIIAKLMF